MPFSHVHSNKTTILMRIFKHIRQTIKTFADRILSTAEHHLAFFLVDEKLIKNRKRKHKQKARHFFIKMLINCRHHSWESQWLDYLSELCWIFAIHRPWLAEGRSRPFDSMCVLNSPYCDCIKNTRCILFVFRVKFNFLPTRDSRIAFVALPLIDLASIEGHAN